MRVQATEHTLHVGTKVYLREDSEWINYDSHEGHSNNPLNVEGVVTAINPNSTFKVVVKWYNNTNNSYTYDDLDIIVPNPENYNRYHGRQIPKHEFI